MKGQHKNKVIFNTSEYIPSLFPPSSKIISINASNITHHPQTIH